MNGPPRFSLIFEAEKSWINTRNRQSTTLKQATDEYRRRYGIHPPPNFDRWYQFAKARNMVLIDEFDEIHELLAPFWGIKPSSIRARTVEALGFPPDQNELWGVQIRNGNITLMTERGWGYMKDIIPQMIGGFMQWLPDMDLAFNMPDEPRVVVPHDELSQLMKTAQTESLARARANKMVKNEFTDHSASYQKGFPLSETTRFFKLRGEPTWESSTLSCSPNSAARNFEDPRQDNVAGHSVGVLGFPQNITGATDICNLPSLQSAHGYFVMTCGTVITHDLVPVFSSSKMSSYSDILIPAPWYWMAANDYNEATDLEWSAKNETFYWRGSTTGGCSHDGRWKYQHRQRFVEALQMTEGQATVLDRVEMDNGYAPWMLKEVSRAVYRDFMDVGFTNIVQCEGSDCDDQRAFFSIKEAQSREEGWRHRHLLDIDGNAFSGRFLTLLRSKSLVYKAAVFRDWTTSRLWPWIHYIPLSMRFNDPSGMGSDWLETVRFFTSDPFGRREAERLADLKRKWVAGTMRKEDMEVWFFRLLLEYGRVIDDARESIGYIYQ
ncbi:glycosyltransferase family 90 protein [Xylariaceae sp. FL0255]|nr:glycosyltransferase family 90 protein [Xylariaceae sp. FL0255]